MLENVDPKCNSSKRTEEYTIMNKFENSEEKGESKCPYTNYLKTNQDNIYNSNNHTKINNSSEISNFDLDHNKLLEKFSNHNHTLTNEIVNKPECPYKNNMLLTSTSYPSLENYNKSTSQPPREENNNTSGCPMFNMIRKEPEEIFSFYFEIPFESPYDFLFNTKGDSLTKKEFLEKTVKLRLMPRHLKYSLLYLKEEKLLKLRQKEFPQIYFTYEELREKAYDFYSKKEYKQAIKYYIFTYSIFKWLEFKDKSRDRDILNANEIIPILDDDIEENRIRIDNQTDTYEEECYKTCLTTILKNMALCYIHLRHFKESIICLNEAIHIANEKVPELYLRRSQARTYNKFSDKSELELAMKDIEIAIKLNENEARFQTHLEILKKSIEEYSTKEMNRTHKLISNAKYSFEKINEKKLNLNDYVYNSYDHIETNNKVLDEMMEKYKNTLKFHNESNNQKQIELAYKEIEEFSEILYKFKWYYSFDVNKLPENVNKNFCDVDM